MGLGVAFVYAAYSLCWVQQLPPRMGTRRKAGIPQEEHAVTSFEKLGLSESLCEGVMELGISVPSEPQRLAWAPLHSGENAVLLSEAGSGKTLAYLLPLLNAMVLQAGEQEELPPLSTGQLLVVVPTQDLAVQVAALARIVCGPTLLQVALAANAWWDAHVVVGTAHSAAQWLLSARSSARRGTRSGAVHPELAHERPIELRVVVDEADVCMAGLQRKGGKATSSKLPIAHVLDAASSNGRREGSARSQLVLVSATLPAQGGRSLGAYVLGRYPSIRWLRSDGAHKPIATLTTEFVRIQPSPDGSEGGERDAALMALLHAREGRTVVFANSVMSVEVAAARLRLGGIKCSTFHPELSAEQRAAALTMLRHGEEAVLVSSGLAARGIDFDVRLVVQYELAPNIVEYMHRVGRTARGGAPGRAVALVTNGVEREEALQKEVERCVRGSWKFL